MNGFLALVALIGLLLFAIGRWIISAHARDISIWWCWGIRFVPLADIMFLARYWELGKSGALTSLIGLVLVLPAVGKSVWDKKHPAVDPYAALFAKLSGDQKNGMFVEISTAHEARVHLAEKKIQRLNDRMAPWFQAMQAKRTALKSDEAVAAFNEEAAAYSALLAVAREEAATLADLRAKTYTGWTQITLEDAHPFLEEMMRNADRD